MRVVAVLAVLGRGLIPADTPFIKSDDLGLTRGDGVFESIHVRAGRPWLLDEHLARMSASAATLDLTLPPLRELAAQACSAWPGDREGVLKLVLTRGSESLGTPTAYATVNPVPAASIAARDNGIKINTLSLGVPVEARKDAPWLLAGAKTLSYAINMATQRYAMAKGADDALWVSTDGFALEGPTSSLVWRSGSSLATVPAAATGILPGITARFALDNASSMGLQATERMITVEELHAVDAVWLLSSIRGIAPIKSIDGVPLRDFAADTARLRAMLGF
ncbi:aminotransferase class IV [Allorhizocola rhizosphaerae]|uniref:aminotransferase class IV n=1 Tax=Allorhizocola rhizosphaerae TaxID=1872709 RepID=UPI000E3CF13D|nr:aminotransferase class IV [Allorhizocola rhizosphaerae]